MPTAKISCIPGVTLEKLDPNTLAVLKEFQQHINSPVVVTSAYRQGDDGEHGKGLAVDIIVPGYKGRLLDLYLASERFPFGGVGVYPEWYYDGQVVGGLHLDIRPVTKGARWLGVKTNGQNQYLSLDQNTLKKYGVI